MKKHPRFVSALIASILPILGFYFYTLLKFPPGDYTFLIDAHIEILCILLLVFNILSGIFSAWLYRRISSSKLTLQQSIKVGALNGLITPLFDVIGFLWIAIHIFEDYFQLLIVIAYLLIIPLSTLSGLVGGLLGGLAFRNHKASSTTETLSAIEQE